MQLGPTVSLPATKFGLNNSFMSRILQCSPYVKDVNKFPQTFGYDPRLVTMLIYNYRSLPGILDLYNDMFYNSTSIAKVRKELELSPSPIAFILGFICLFFPYFIIR